MGKYMCDDCDLQRKCVFYEDGYYIKDCKDFKPMTNEEFIRTCTTEQLAEELLDHFMWGVTVNAEECFTKEYISRIKKHIMEWLKEIHE